jgi:hypothetical protein
VLVCLTLAVSAQETPRLPPRARSCCIENARLIPGDGQPAIESSAFLVRDGVITALAARAT